MTTDATKTTGRETRTRTSLKFETTTCGRCGGSGNYSYCQMYGTRCFGCSGSGIVLSCNGKRAQAKANELLAAATTILADTLTVGMKYRTTDIAGRKVWATVLTTPVHDAEPSGWSETNGVRTMNFAIHFDAKIGKNEVGVQLWMGMDVMRPATTEEWASIVESVRKMKGCEVVVTEVKA